MKQINAGIIGSGFMGAAHIEALQRIGNVKVIAMASTDMDTAKKLADSYSIEEVTNDYKDIINNEDVDIIHNCTPNFLHFDINNETIERGKHIISEKPLAISSKQSASLLESLKKNRVVNAINFNYRSYPLVQHARSMVNNNEVGDIFLVHGNYLQDWLYYDTDYNWRLEKEIGGDSRAIADIGSHWCDLIQFVIGLKIKKVYANLITIHSERMKPSQKIETFKGKEKKLTRDGQSIKISTEDAGSVLLEFEEGAQGVFTVSQVSAGRKNHFWFEIDGSKKAIAWNQEKPNEMWIGYRDKANEILIKDPSLVSKEAKNYAHYPGGHPEGYPDGMKNLFLRVYDFVRSGKSPQKDKPDFPTFEDGHWENKIVEAIIKSNKEKKWIEV
jgi:predicted dehydrogenase